MDLTRNFGWALISYMDGVGDYEGVRFLFERRRLWAGGILLSRNTSNKVPFFPLSEIT
jgi:hypothetical protein